eukprot:1161677-Pelagomonas_calceolata.AAC.8
MDSRTGQNCATNSCRVPIWVVLRKSLSYLRAKDKCLLLLACVATDIPADHTPHSLVALGWRYKLLKVLKLEKRQHGRGLTLPFCVLTNCSHQCHRVAAAHRKLLVGKRFQAKSPNGRFQQGAEVGVSMLSEGVALDTCFCCATHYLQHIKGLMPKNAVDGKVLSRIEVIGKSE